MVAPAPFASTGSRTSLNTWFGWLGSIAGIIGLVTSIYFYHASQRYRELAYYLSPIKTSLVSSQVSDLRVFYRDKEVTEVTSAQVAIWNRGNEPIHPEHVIDAITIVTKPARPILKATIVRVTRPLIGFACDQTQLDKGKISVSWKILEQGDGAVVQLIYAGSPTTDIVLKGAVEGQRSITALKYGGKIQSASEQVTSERKRPLKLLGKVCTGRCYGAIGRSGYDKRVQSTEIK